MIDMENFRKVSVSISANGPIPAVNYLGYFHEWGSLDGNSYAIIEKEDGSIKLDLAFYVTFIEEVNSHRVTIKDFLDSMPKKVLMNVYPSGYKRYMTTAFLRNTLNDAINYYDKKYIDEVTHLDITKTRGCGKKTHDVFDKLLDKI